MTYHIETYWNEKWIKIIDGSKQFCEGYLYARTDYAPRPYLRMVRSDGKIVQELPAVYEVYIGQVAGWPTAEQYERAGNEALEKARVIREDKNRRWIKAQHLKDTEE